MRMSSSHIFSRQAELRPSQRFDSLPDRARFDPVVAHERGIDDLMGMRELLGQALAMELGCLLRYKHHYFVASGLGCDRESNEFDRHAQQELRHTSALSERIVQLGGTPDFLSPNHLTAINHSEYVAYPTLKDMIRESLTAERIATNRYRAMIGLIGSDDPSTRRVLEDILEARESRIKDIASLLEPV